ncbi:folate-binding protein [Microbulbifer agarilyticus]|uniref:CAF17-like 4Fe-4S cluster assembly/insertion protein YgfZ n=1 Tax=Microbulbifer agarilyticus TaxID=260552 RepID=UPI001C98BC02|nr:folate-binding protein [Microbulbifer agarilyticus]MBY6189766.1 folate-binding protein [Microbulbifer agarilyticus]
MDQQQWQDFLSTQGALWRDGYAEFANDKPESKGALRLIDLSPLGAIAINGPDSQKFLQGQLTCDLVNLPDGQLTLGSHCNPKGRMISAFFALKLSQSEFVLLMPRDLVATALAALKKYAVFFKTELSDISEEQRWLALCGRDACQAANSLLALSNTPDSDLLPHQLRPFDHNGHPALAAGLSERNVVLQVPAEQAADIWQKLASNGAEPGSYQQWLLQLIDSGVPLVYHSTSEVFIPQMLNLHLLDAVSFKKGCYTGQEVVARMQYLGATKRRMYRAQIDSGELPAPGEEIFTAAGGSSIGNIVQASSQGDDTALLAVLTKSKVADGESLQLKDGRVLELLELPYDADADPLA